MKKEKKINCIICSGNAYKHYYPDIFFNNKHFNYYQCVNCKTIQIHPLPSEEDFNMMYGLADHTYLSKTEKITYTQISNKKNHQNLQLYFFDKYKYYKNAKTLLDYGCGSGFYIHHAKKYNLECTGVEFNKEFSRIVAQKSGYNIVSIDDIGEQTFDLIHVGHVLEHLTNPYEIIEQLKKFAHKNTLFIFDGPLENNACLSRYIIKLGSKIKQKKQNSIDPQHITLTNYNSQLLFFNNCMLNKINYEVCEVNFPLPDKIDLKKPHTIPLYLLSELSVQLSKLHPKFDYAGRIK
ncbi:MAG: class I SAM-dependent methyltransferase [Bacteroidia bacterium]